MGKAPDSKISLATLACKICDACDDCATNRNSYVGVCKVLLEVRIKEE